MPADRNRRDSVMAAKMLLRRHDHTGAWYGWVQIAVPGANVTIQATCALYKNRV